MVWFGSVWFGLVWLGLTSVFVVLLCSILFVWSWGGGGGGGGRGALRSRYHEIFGVSLPAFDQRSIERIRLSWKLVMSLNLMYC